MSSRHPLHDLLVFQLYWYSSPALPELDGAGEVGSPVVSSGASLQATGADWGYPAASTSVRIAFDPARANSTGMVRPGFSALISGRFLIGGSKPMKGNGSTVPQVLPCGTSFIGAMSSTWAPSGPSPM